MGMIIFLSVLTFFLFFLKGIVLLDPDFGWHLRLGEIITSSGIPATDPLSYTMPSFPYIDIQWLTNVFFKVFYPLVGTGGLSLIYSLVAFLTLFLIFKNKGKKLFWEVPFVFAASILFGYFGVRPQVSSWLLWAIFLAIVLNEERWKKWRYLLPGLVVLWVNLHGSFALSIVTLLILTAVRLWQRKLKLDLILVLIISILASFINPYGVRIWHEVWLQVSDASLRWKILEWQPALFSFNLPFISFLAISLTLVWINRKRFRLEELVLFAFFLFQGLGSVRHVPLWVILSLPMTIAAFTYTLDRVKKIRFAKERFRKLYRWALYGSLVIALSQFILGFNGAKVLSEGEFYPREATVFLEKNLPSGQIFSEYGWGGYLSWKLPQKKVFIDGRMPSWRYKENPSGESGYIMKEYVDMLSDKVSYKEVFEKYGVEVVLWPQKRKARFLDALSQKIEELLFKKEIPFDLTIELEKDGWKRVYEDNTSQIFVTPR